jgi:hypothetical protein
MTISVERKKSPQLSIATPFINRRLEVRVGFQPRDPRVRTAKRSGEAATFCKGAPTQSHGLDLVELVDEMKLGHEIKSQINP